MNSPQIKSFAHRLGGIVPVDGARSALGGLVGILIAGAVATYFYGGIGELPLLMAPIGASAVLVFAVPASPLAQPWSVIGGNCVSALVGISAAHLVDWPLLAAAIAVGGSIGAMTILRCLHPPGGAVALTAVIGAPAIVGTGYYFALSPVLIDSVLLTLAAIAYNRLAGRSYPHKAHPPENPHPLGREVILSPDDFDAVLADYGEALDIGRDDLEALYVELRGRAEKRRGDLGESADHGPPVRP